MTNENKEKIKKMWCEDKMNSLDISIELGITLAEVNEFIKSNKEF